MAPVTRTTVSPLAATERLATLPIKPMARPSIPTKSPHLRTTPAPWHSHGHQRPCVQRHNSLSSSSQEVLSGALPLDGASTSSPDDAEALARAGWDPEGIFSSAPPLSQGTDLFARQAARRKQAAAQASPVQPGQHGTVAPGSCQLSTLHQPETNTVPFVPDSSNGVSKAEPVATALTPSQTDASQSATISNTEHMPGGEAKRSAAQHNQLQIQSTKRIPAAQDSPQHGYSREQMQALLADRFVGVDMSWPGLSVLHMDPPVLHVETFLTPKQCQEWMKAAEATGSMQVSKIGAGNANAAPVDGTNAYDQRRTSLSILLDPSIQARHPALQRLVQAFQSRAQSLLKTGSRAWGKPGRMPSAGQYTFESPQVARYEQGQHFLSHEDAFPLRLARHNGFQRHATLLLYLNDVAQGGATAFDHLGLAVQPTQGSLLIFFPAFSDCRPDPRSLHTAQDAHDTKWVMQQWVARGFTEPPPPAAQATVPAAPAAAPTPAAPAQPQAVSGDAAQSSTAGTSSGSVSQQIFTVPVAAAQQDKHDKAKKPARKTPAAKKGFGSK